MNPEATISEPAGAPTCKVRQVNTAGFLIAIVCLLIGPVVALVNLTGEPDVRVWGPAALAAAAGALLWHWCYVPVHLELGPSAVRIRPRRGRLLVEEVPFTHIARCMPASETYLQAMHIEQYNGWKRNFSTLTPAKAPFIGIDDWAYALVTRVEQERVAAPFAHAAARPSAPPPRRFGRGVVSTVVAAVAGLLLVMGARVWLLPGREGPPWWLLAALVVYLGFYFRGRFATRWDRSGR
jgi:hypothetical protein